MSIRLATGTTYTATTSGGNLTLTLNNGAVVTLDSITLSSLSDSWFAYI